MQKNLIKTMNKTIGSVPKIWVHHDVFAGIFATVIENGLTTLLPQQGIYLAGGAVIYSNRIGSKMPQLII